VGGGHRQATRTGPQIEQVRLLRQTEGQERFDQVLGLGARDQDGRRDPERQRPELLRAGEVLERLVGGPPRREGPEPGRGVGLDGRVGVGMQPGAIGAENVRQQRFRLACGLGDAAGGENLAPLLDEGRRGPAAFGLPFQTRTSSFRDSAW
jgi:hypothetical protein